MVDDLTKTFEANTTLTNITIEKSDTNDDIGKLTELGNFLRSGQSNEGAKTSSRQDRFESSSDFSLDRVTDRGSQLDVRVLADDVLLVLVKKIVEDLLVEQGDALEVIARAGLETDNLINQAVRLVRQVGDVLLSLHFLFNVSGVVADLQLDRV